MVKEIIGSEGFVSDDGTPLAELREQIVDEIANYERKGSADEVIHQRKGTMGYSPYVTQAKRAVAPAPGVLVGDNGASHQLFTETTLGRSSNCEVPIHDGSLSRHHARIMYVDGRFVLQDLGSTNGCYVNGKKIVAAKAAISNGDIVQLGFVKFKLVTSK